MAGVSGRFWTDFSRSSTLPPDWCSQRSVPNTSPRCSMIFTGCESERIHTVPRLCFDVPLSQRYSSAYTSLRASVGCRLTLRDAAIFACRRRQLQQSRPSDDHPRASGHSCRRCTGVEQSAISHPSHTVTHHLSTRTDDILSPIEANSNVFYCNS